MGEPVNVSDMRQGTRTIGEALVQLLERHEVRHVFGIPGTHNLEIYRGLVGSRIAHITPRHEQGAAYAADGYARSLGGPGVIITTSGPAILNAAAGLGTSYADSIPVLAISPGPPRGNERRDLGWLHEVKDQRSAMDHIVSRSVRCESFEHLEEEIDGTFARWSVGRARPVHIEIPVDVLESVTSAPMRPEPPSLRSSVDTEAIESAVELLARATRPMIVAGGGSFAAGRTLARLAEKIGAPVVTTLAAKATVPEDHPLAVGASLPTASEVLEYADLLLVVGSELADADIPLEALGKCPVVRIDIDAAQLMRPVVPSVAVLGDAEAAVRLLETLVAARSPQHIEAALSAAARLRARTRSSGSPEFEGLHASLAEVLGADAIISGDSSQVSYRGTAMQFPQRVERSFLYPNGFATLGYAIPAAIGAKVAHPSRQVVALLGDGAFMFSVQELATAVQHRLDITAIVIDNGGYREIREQMDERQISTLAVDLQHPDFTMLGMAFGWDAREVSSTDELAAALVAERPQNAPPRLLVVREETLR